MMKCSGYWGNSLRKAALTLCSCILGVVVLAGCSTPVQQAVSRSPITSLKNTTIHVDANIVHTMHVPAAVGVANLTWDPAAQVLMVHVFVTGLAPNSAHPDHIHAGTCASNPMGPIVYSLNPLIANVYGDGTSKTIIKGVKEGIPQSRWYVNVHQGPTLKTPQEAMPIACGNVSHRRMTSLHDQQSVSLFLVGSDIHPA
jgi:hypothetical protein